MTIRQYFSKAREYARKLHETNGVIAETRLRNFKNSVSDGTLEKFLKVVIPISGAVSIAGTLTDDYILRNFGMGALIMGCIYTLALPRKTQ